jgi:citrate synthase
MLMARTATISFEGKQVDLPVIEGSEGELGIDIGQLRAKTGLITLDEGYSSTGACRSAITFIDGETGILRYRGIPIEQLAEKSNFVETAYLLIFGHLPNKQQDERFRSRLTANAHLHESFKHHFEGFPVDAPPMAMLSAMVNTLACFHQQFLKIEDDEAFEEATARIISKVRTLSAYNYRMSRGLPMMYPDPKLKYVQNFLHMMFSGPYQQYEPDPDVVSALDMILLLHADHEQNCSTSTVRIVGSSKANLFASVAAGIGALWGPLHGGANVAVLEMLDAIHKGKITPDEYLRLSKDKTSGVRLMGFGHRVYKNFDPRAEILKRASDKVLAKIGDSNDPLLNIARKLEELALKDSYFVERKLYPNVDFYSGIIMKAIGIPVNMFTVMFAIGRMPGWIAQWKEQADESESRIARPRQIYTGSTKTDYTPMAKRK